MVVPEPWSPVAESGGAPACLTACVTTADLTADPTAALGAAQDGDEAGFVAVYRDVQPRLLRYAMVLIGRDGAEDVTAEAWLQISRDLHRFAGDVDRFRGWAATIVHHRAMDLCRANARRPREQAQAVLLRAVVGLDARAAGAVLGKRAGAVRVAAHRGLKKLAQQARYHPEEGRWTLV